jgi:hypothetical protein
MPTKYLSLEEIRKEDLTWDSSKIELTKEAFLLPTDENGEVSFSKDGKFRESSEIEFPNSRIDGLTELWSFEIEAYFEQNEDGDDLGSIVLQLSNDNGATYLYYNAGWITAGANDWNTEEEVQNNIDTFPFIAGSFKQIRPKARISPDNDNKSSPRLYELRIHYEIDFIPERDVVDSLKNKIDTEVEVITEVGVIIRENLDRFNVPFKVKVESVIGAWNLTTDPGRLNNIFSSLDQTLSETKETGEEIYDPQIIILTGSQNTDDDIIARIKLKIPVYIAPDSDYTIADYPKYVMEIGDHFEDLDFRNDGRKNEKNKAKGLVRLRDFPQTYRMPIVIVSYSADDLFAKEMNRELIRKLKDKKILSLKTSEELQILEEEEFASANSVREDLSAKQFSFAVIYRDWIGDYEEVPIVTSFISITDRGGHNES